jgi:hypothetical protein
LYRVESMRAFIVVWVTTLGVARADTSAPAVADGWVQLCEADLRRAAAWYGQGSPDLERWDWQTESGAIRAHYYWLHGELDYQLAVSRTSQQSHPWRTRLIHNKRFPDVVDEWWIERVAAGRLASFRAAGLGGLRGRDRFLKAFQPALESCLRR